jgi:hypothetical protein
MSLQVVRLDIQHIIGVPRCVTPVSLLQRKLRETLEGWNGFIVCVKHGFVTAAGFVQSSFLQCGVSLPEEAIDLWSGDLSSHALRHGAHQEEKGESGISHHAGHMQERLTSGFHL